MTYSFTWKKSRGKAQSMCHCKHLSQASLLIFELRKDNGIISTLQYLITKLQHDCYKHKWAGGFWACSVSDIILLLSLLLSRRRCHWQRFVFKDTYLLCNNVTRRLWPWPAMINTIINSFYLSICNSFFFCMKIVISSQWREDQRTWPPRRHVQTSATTYFIFPLSQDLRPQSNPAIEPYSVLQQRTRTGRNELC